MKILDLIKNIFSDSAFNDIFYKSSYNFLLKISSIGLGLALHVYLARLLEIEGYGYYTIVITASSFIMIFLTFGVEVVTLKEVPKYLTNNQAGLLRGLIMFSFRIIGINSFLLLLVWLVIYYNSNSVAIEYSENLTSIFLLTVASAVFIYLTNLLQSIGGNSVVISQSSQLVKIVSLFILVIFIPILSSGKSYLSLSLWFFFISTMISIVYLVYFIHLKLPIMSLDNAKDNVKQWIKLGTSFFLTNVFVLILSQSGIIFLAALSGSKSAAMYSTALKLSSLTLFGVMAVNAYIAPMIARYYKKDNLDKVQSIISIASKIIFLFSVCMGIILLFFGKWMLNIFGDEFILAYIPMVIILVGFMVDSFCGSVGVIMGMTGHHRQMVVYLGTISLINIILNITLINFYDVTGAAIASTLSTILLNLILLRFVRDKIKLNPAFNLRLYKKISHDKT
jgi:O-antigen/teichoic acid export membrane protein